MPAVTDDRSRAAELAVTRILAELPDTGELIPRILQAICETLNWEWSALWTPDAQRKVLECRAVWHPPLARLSSFETVSTKTVFPPGLGMPGRVWQSGEPAWIPDVTRDTNFPRAPWALEAGLHSSFAFPIRAGGEILGVMEFFSPEIRQTQQDLLQSFAVLGGQIGQFIQRRRAEENVRVMTTALANAVEGIAQINSKGVYVSVNGAYAATFGYAESDLLERDWRTTISSENQAAVEAALERASLMGKGLTEAWGLRKDGSRFPIQCTVIRLADRPEQSSGHYVFVQDITLRKREEDRRLHEMALLNSMVRMLQACLSEAEACVVVGRSAAELFPETRGTIFSVRRPGNVIEAVSSWGTLDSDAPPTEIYAIDDCWALRRGQVHYVGDSGSGITCAHVAAPGSYEYLCVPLVAQSEMLGVLHVVSASFDENRQRLATTLAEQCSLALANVRLRESLQALSARDALTGLYNRRFLEETLDRELLRAARHQKSVGILLIDVDHFKAYNDSFGHDAGDAVLRTLAGALQGFCRGTDVVARLGGEEFVMVLPEATLEDTAQKAEKIRESVARQPLAHAGNALSAISLSIGVASFPQHGSTREALMKAADIAVYRAKREGRARTVVAD